MAKKTRESGKKIIRPGSDIIAETVDALNKKLFKALDQAVSELTLDFKNVKTVDPVGLSVIAAAHNTVRNTGSKMVLKNVPHEIDKLFDMLGLNEHLEVK